MGFAVDNLGFLRYPGTAENISDHRGAGDVPGKVQTLCQTQVKSLRSLFLGSLFRMERKRFGKFCIEAFHGHTDELPGDRAPFLRERQPVDTTVHRFTGKG
jgi:hypothetical protein